MSFLLSFCLFSFALAANGAIGRQQSIAASGRLLCHGLPAAGVTVKLYDEDRTDIDDLIAETKTDENGRFYLSGTEYEFTAIDPKLNIYHDCNDGFSICQRKLEIFIPDEYISRGAVALKVYNLAVLNLDAEFRGETHDCFH